MTRITRSADCGNSPKNAAVEAVAIGLEGGEWSGHSVTDETLWNGLDGNCARGPEEIKGARLAPENIRIEHAIAHGKVGAVSGVTDGEAFAHIFTFTSASMKQLVVIDSFRKTEKAHG